MVWCVISSNNRNFNSNTFRKTYHGSKTSSTTEFLRAVQPDYVLIPAGYRNQFGHPHKDVLARYRQIHAKWLTSADSGAIAVNSENNALVVQGMREMESRYWNAK